MLNVEWPPCHPERAAGWACEGSPVVTAPGWWPCVLGIHRDDVRCILGRKLPYFEEYSDPRQAIAREKQLKSWRREKKDALIRTVNPELYDLQPQLCP